MKRVTIRLIPFLLLCCQPRATDEQRPPAGGLPQVESATEAEHFQDVVMRVTDVAETPDETRIQAAAMRGTRRLGLRLVVAKGMKPGLRGTSIDRSAFRPGGIRIESLGAESDAFVQELAKLYGVQGETRMNQTVAFTAFALEGSPSAIRRQHLNFKVFHDEDDKYGQYCELYIHVDLPAGEIRIDEKDQEYRKAVISALGRPAV